MRNCPTEGSISTVAAGMGAGIDYGGAVDRLIAELEAAGGSPNDIVLWQARWLVGNDSLNGSEALAAVKAVKGLDEGTQQTMVRELVYTALLVTGRDSNKKDSPYAANFERGYATLELVFPGIAGQKS